MATFYALQKLASDSDAGLGQGRGDYLLGLLLNEVQVCLALEALHVDLVDGLGSGVARR